MATAVVLAAGANLVLVPPEPGPVRSFARSAGRSRRGRPAGAAEIPPDLIASLRRRPPELRLAAAGASLREGLGAVLGRPVGAPSPLELNEARGRAPWPTGEEERELLRSTAGAALEAALRSPVEILISLAREEERFERVLEREARASDAFLPVPGSPLAAYADQWTRRRAQLAEHHRALEEMLALEARRTVPNLTAVVGGKVASRLVAAAGGLAPLGRMGAPRLQLLGSRRRPSPERGPRYGALYRADRMSDVPPDRRAAYARSLAALAAIAARADATTRTIVAPLLVARRDRRVADLARRRT